VGLSPVVLDFKLIIKIKGKLNGKSKKNVNKNLYILTGSSLFEI